ncbi:MAG: hypothetical protein HXX11_00175 [Desulfuromonadales bacterium]|nr:hypothetical protein [Desulfuromonadales bacterium]
MNSVEQPNRTYQSLSETTVKINQVADSVRQADATMQKVGSTLNKMKSSLEEIIKNYPPFPPGSEQRVKALKSFAALRNEIEKLTFPPPPSLVPKLISDPAKAPGSFSVTLDSQGTSVRLDRQQIDPGPSGLNIPVLPTNPPQDSGDEPIHHAISALYLAAKTVSDRRQSLSDNFAQQALPAAVTSVTNQTGLSGAAQGTATLSEQSASANSRDISGIFSAIPVGMAFAGDTFLKRLT